MKRRAKARPAIKPLIEVCSVAGVIGVRTLAVVTIGTSAARNGGNRMDPRKQAIMDRALIPGPGPWNPRPVHPAVMPCPMLTRPADAGQVLNPNQYGYPVAVPPRVFHVTILWRDTRNNKHLVFYSGSETADATQGAVIVLDFNGCNGEDRPTGEFPMTTKMGPFTLTGVEGDIASFAYQSGRGTFNLDSHQFAMPKGRLLPSAGSLPVH